MNKKGLDPKSGGKRAQSTKDLAKPLEKRLTDVELEIMTILWRIQEGTVNEVLENLPEGRDLAYTSVSTMLRILESKGIVSAKKEGRGHLYRPILGKSEYESSTVRHVVDKVFDGAPLKMVRQLLLSDGLDADELEEIRKLIERRGR